jgi:hypothetical protein
LYTRCMMRRPMAVVFNCTECGKMASVKCNAGESRKTSKRVRIHMKGIHQFITNSTTEKFSQSKDPPTQKDPTKSNKSPHKSNKTPPNQKRSQTNQNSPCSSSATLNARCTT